MRIMVTRRTEFPRPGTPLTFEVYPGQRPQLLPHDVRDHVVAVGAGYLVPHQAGQTDRGIAALIAGKQQRRV